MNLNRKKQRVDELAATTGARVEGNVDAGGIKDAEGVSLLASAWRRLRRNPAFLIGAVVVVLFVLVALFAPVLTGHDPSTRYLIGEVSQQNNPVPKARPGFPLGGDPVGRDLYARLVFGARNTLLVAVLATLTGFVGGLILGSLAGAFGGWVDSVVMRVVDIMLSLPSLLLAFSIAALFGRASQWSVILAVGIAQIPIFARLLRGAMMAQRHSDHVLAARSLGVKPGSIVLRHMLPNSLSPVLVQATMVVATSIIDAAALSYIGAGNADDTQPEWGQMLGQAQNLIDSYPHLAVYPAICIIVVALGFTLMGESLREALDPKSRR
ncbi:ABC transporter permease [Metallococcus carri]|nr:ABC transporter permease [Metallococcus carri]